MATTNCPPIDLSNNKVSYDRGHPTFPVSVSSQWVDAAIVVSTVDTTPFLNPEVAIPTAANRSIIQRKNYAGTNIAWRLKYDDGCSGAVTALKFFVFGRTNSQPWELLRNKAGSIEHSITPIPGTGAGSDGVDGTWQYTTVHLTDHITDCLGCDEFVIVVSQALAIAVGTVTSAILQAKVF